MGINSLVWHFTHQVIEKRWVQKMSRSTKFTDLGKGCTACIATYFLWVILASSFVGTILHFSFSYVNVFRFLWIINHERNKTDFHTFHSFKCTRSIRSTVMHKWRSRIFIVTVMIGHSHKSSNLRKLNLNTLYNGHWVLMLAKFVGIEL